MRLRWLAVWSCLFAALAFGVAACGDDDDDDGGGGGGGGDTAKVVSSLPLQGASRPQTTAMVDGMELALKQRDNKAGDVTIEYESLDDSTAQVGSWTPEATSANAREAAQDDSVVAYIEVFGRGCIGRPIHFRHISNTWVFNFEAGRQHVSYYHIFHRRSICRSQFNLYYHHIILSECIT